MSICTLDEVLRYMGKGGLAPGPDLDLIADLWPQAERAVKKYVVGPVETTSCVDLLPTRMRQFDPDYEFVGYDVQGGKAYGYYPWDVQQVLQLQQTPVRSVEAVYETWTPGGGQAPAPGALLDPGSYLLDASEPGLSRGGLLVKPYGVWPSAGRSVQVRYTAGYTPRELAVVVPEFRLAVKMQVARAYRTAKAVQDQQMGFSGVGPITSEGMDGVTFAYDGATVRLLSGQITDLSPEVKGMLAEHVNYGDLVGH